LKFLGKVWAGRACAGANEVELTKVPKSGGRRRKKRGGKKKKGGGRKNKMGPVHGQWATASLSHCRMTIFNFFDFFFDFFWSYEEHHSILEEWVFSTPIF
jgi:hypothetical protein